jgi:RimJ/RimL family protein N-acetyltransferase
MSVAVAGTDAPVFTFRALGDEDLDLVRAWLLRPHVRRWYDDVAGEAYPDDTIAEYRIAMRGDDPTDYFIVELDDRPIGQIQSYLIDDEPEYAAMLDLGRPAFGIDLFIGEPELIGRGHGPALIRAFLRDVGFSRYSVDLCVIGPTTSNVAAIRAYEKAGFRFFKNYLEPETREPPHYLMKLSRVEFDAGEM